MTIQSGNTAKRKICTGREALERMLKRKRGVLLIHLLKSKAKLSQNAKRTADLYSVQCKALSELTLIHSF